MRVVLFGGTGFIGRYLIKALADVGCQVVVATRRPALGYKLSPMGQVGQIITLGCDVRQDADITTICQGADVVVNLIGILAENKQGDFARVHTNLPARLASCAKAAGVKKFVQMSALGADVQAKSVYLQSKALGEQAVLEAFQQATIVRPSIVFGLGDGFFSLFAKLGKFMPFWPLIGGGHTLFQPVYVIDVVQAIVNIIMAPQALAHAGQTYSLGGPQTYSFKQLLQLINPNKPCVPLPWGLAMLQGRIMQHLPGKLITPDQVLSLQTNNVLPKGVLGLNHLGVTPTCLEAILPSYLNVLK